MYFVKQKKMRKTNGAGTHFSIYMVGFFDLMVNTEKRHKLSKECCFVTIFLPHPSYEPALLLLLLHLLGENSKRIKKKIRDIYKTIMRQI